jgi:hypothetical protein
MRKKTQIYRTHAQTDIALKIYIYSFTDILYDCKIVELILLAGFVKEDTYGG